MEAATRLMSEKDEEIQKLEEQIKSMKTQYMRMSRSGAPAEEGLKLEGNEPLSGCSANNGCLII